MIRSAVIALSLLPSLAVGQMDTVWTGTFGGAGGDFVRKIIRLDESGYVSVGSSTSFGTDSTLDGLMVSFGADGGFVDQKVFEEVGLKTGLISVSPALESGYVVVGFQDLDKDEQGIRYRGGYFAKLGATGEIELEAVIEKSFFNYFYAGIELSDGHYAMGGEWSDRRGQVQVASVFKMDTTGAIVAGTSITIGHVELIDELPSGDVFAITTDYRGGQNTLFTARLDSDWQIQGAVSHPIWINTTDAKKVADGYIVVGDTWPSSCSSGTHGNVIVKLDRGGGVEWDRLFGTYCSDPTNRMTGVAQTPDGGYIVVGHQRNSQWVFSPYLTKFDAQGNQIWEQIVGAPNNPRPEAAVDGVDGGTVLIGEFDGDASGDIFLTSLVEQVETSVTDHTIPDASFELRPNYPNPFTGKTRIPFVVENTADVNISVLDLLGREVADLASGMHQAGEYEVVWDASSVPSGHYLCRFQVGTQSHSRILAVLR